MIPFLRKNIFAVLLTGCLTACSTKQQDKNQTETPGIGNAIYYWRTNFEITAADEGYLRRHDIRRIYLRMFDVTAEFNPDTDCYEAVPIATTRFRDSTAFIYGSSHFSPQINIEIVPTVYITHDALLAMQGEERKYAELIVERLRAMASYNDCGTIREMQFDCDWTASTRASYAELCRAARKLLHAESIALSATIRLHQLSEAAPPVDSGVLMLYNTGALKSPDTRNSILDINDVRPYLHRRKCNIPLNYAYPAFGWGVKFHDGKFQRIVTHPETEALGEGDSIRIERATAAEVLAVKALVEGKLGKPSRYNILYHLDNEQLKHYTKDEISEIYVCR